MRTSSLAGASIAALLSTAVPTRTAVAEPSSITGSVAVVGVPTASVGSPATAAATTEASQEIQEIIVTAQKRSQRLLDVPISITAVSGDQLAQQGITTTADLQKAVPGFTYALSALGGPVYTIRGIGSYTESIDVSPAVSVYSDQVPLPFSRMAEGAALDLERVEVLKGPQGTLFGQNSTGGAINYIPAKPTRDLEVGGSSTFGSFTEADADAFVSGPVSDDLLARVAFRTEHRDGWQYNYDPPVGGEPQAKNGVRDFTDARILVDWFPNEQLKVEFNLNGWLDNSESQARQKIGYAAGDPNGSQGSPQHPNLQALIQAYPNAPASDTAASWIPGENLRRNDNFVQASARADYSLQSGATLTSITAFSHLNVYDPWDESATIYADEYGVVAGEISSYSEELRVAGTALQHNALNWLVGANYEHDTTSNNAYTVDYGTTAVQDGFPVYTAKDLNANRVNTEAVFGNLEYNITDALTAQTAVRYTHRSDDFSGCLSDTGDGGAARLFSFISSLATHTTQTIAPGSCVTLSNAFTPLPIINMSLGEANVSYRAGLSWKVEPDVMLYANVTKGYKAGAFETLPALTESEFAPAHQEHVQAYEVGFKSEFFDRTISLDGAGFYYYYVDKQLEGYQETIFGSLPALVSIPKSRIEGGELNLFWKPSQAIKINIGGTYIDSEVTSNYYGSPVFASSGSATVDYKGMAFPFTPKWAVTSDFQYDIPVSSRITGYVGGGPNYHSSTTAAFAGGPLLNIDSFTLLDVRAGVKGQDNKWSVGLWGHNVSNRYYWNDVKSGADVVSRTTGMPRTFGMTVSGRF